MNVTPVTAPGPTSTGQIETRTRSAQPQAPAPDRGQPSPRELAAQRPQNDDTPQSIAQASATIDDADRQKADQLKAFVANDKFSLSTYHDDNSGRQVVEVRDQTTGEVVSQYPSEELIRLYTSLRESLVDERA